MFKSLVHKKLAGIVAVAFLFVAVAHSVEAGGLSLVGTGSGSLQSGISGLFDITDPNNDSVIDTSVWGTAPSGSNPNTQGVFNGPGNNGEQWAKIFDNAIGGVGPWGSSTSKVCCTFDSTGSPPGDGTYIDITSVGFSYTIESYTITNGNDSSPGRNPNAWTIYGSNDGFSTSTALDSVAGQTNWMGTNKVFKSTGMDNPTGSFRQFRVQFTAADGGFHLGELELLSSRAEVAFDNNVGTTTVSDTALFGGTLVFEFDATSSDMLTGPATFDLNDATIELEFLNGLPVAGDYTLLDAPNITGSLGGIIVPSEYAASVDTSNLATNGTVTILFIPEPASIAIWGMLGLAMGTFLWRRRRRSRM